VLFFSLNLDDTMWFRNLRAYRLPERLGLNAEAMAQRLESRPFTPCRPAQPLSAGWVAALDDSVESLVHAAGPYWLLRLKREEKLLPSSVIRDEVGSRVLQIQTAEARKVHRKERLQLTDEVTQDLMPRAFTRARSIEAMVFEKDGWLWVNNASAPRAEDFLSALREALGSLPAVLPVTRKNPAAVMSEWLLHDQLPEGFELGTEADLVEPGEEGGVVRARSMLLDCDEIRAHIESGKQVQRLALAWQGRLEFVLGADLVIRRLKFAEALTTAHDDINEDPLARRDADFLLMSETLAELWPALLQAFGGLEA
jgi:recombination associated protein RdgC